MVNAATTASAARPTRSLALTVGYVSQPTPSWSPSKWCGSGVGGSGGEP